MSKIILNTSVPNFSASATNSNNIILNDYIGKNLLLYFYPRDNTPGCITEGQLFRDNIEKFQQLNTIILGVSRDSLRVHERFKEKYQLPFELISDKDETLCSLFDVIRTKMLYGKQSLGIERSSFLIDKNGVLINEWRKVKVKNHVDDVLSVLTELQNTHSIK